MLTLKTILGLAVIFIIYICIRKDAPSGVIQFFYLLITISTMGYGFSTRPHHFTYIMYALFLLILRKNDKKKLDIKLSIPVLGFIWANLHGAFFIGIILGLVYSLTELIRTRLKSKHALIALAATLIFFGLTFINPYGPRLWNFIFHSGANFRPHLSEWAPFNPIKDFYDHPDFIVLVIISAISLLVSREKKNITWIAILIVSFISAVLMRRNIPLFAITACFVIPEHLTNIAKEPAERLCGRIAKPVLSGILAVLIITSTWYTLNFNKTNPLEIEVQQDKFPVQVIDFMAANNITGNALVFFDWAENCIWNLYPNVKVFTDGRLWSAYSTDVINDYFNFLYTEGAWENALNNYPTDIVLIHTGNPVHAEMAKKEEWFRIFGNEIAVLFLKKSAHKDIIWKIESKSIVVPKSKQNTFFP